MKTVQKICLGVSIVACLLWGLKGIFEIDILQHYLIQFPLVIKAIEIFFAICGMVNILLFSAEIKK